VVVSTIKVSRRFALFENIQRFRPVCPSYTGIPSSDGLYTAQILLFIQCVKRTLHFARAEDTLHNRPRHMQEVVEEDTNLVAMSLGQGAVAKRRRIHDPSSAAEQTVHPILHAVHCRALLSSVCDPRVQRLPISFPSAAGMLEYSIQEWRAGGDLQWRWRGQLLVSCCHRSMTSLPLRPCFPCRHHFHSVHRRHKLCHPRSSVAYCSRHWLRSPDWHNLRCMSDCCRHMCRCRSCMTPSRSCIANPCLYIVRWRIRDCYHSRCRPVQWCQWDMYRWCLNSFPQGRTDQC